MTPDHCPSCPFKGCTSCAYSGGESQPAATVYERMGVATTNGPRRQPETVLATPIRRTNQEGWLMVAPTNARCTTPAREVSCAREV